MITQNKKYIFLSDELEYKKSSIEFLLLSFDDDTLRRFRTYAEEKKFYDKKKETYKFKYVGVIDFDGLVICLFPKYYSIENPELQTANNPKFKDFKDVLRVLKKFEKTARFGKLTTESEELFGSELLLANLILEDYVISGLYINNFTDFILDGIGETNWDLTVNNIDPFFSRRRPIYQSQLTHEEFIEDQYIITRIHKAIVHHCYFNFGDLLDYHLDFSFESPESLSDIGDSEFLISVIKRELRQVFIEKKIYLLDLLEKFIVKVYYRINTSPILYGTNSFHVVWEEVCSSIFNNKLGNKIRDEILNLSQSDFDDFGNKTFLEIIPRPLWHQTYLESFIPDRTLRPDIVTIKKSFFNTEKGHESRLNFFVLDAKYYNIMWSGSGSGLKLENYPGVEDVTKQILYEHVYNDKFEIYFNGKYNILLFPKLDQIHPSDSFFCAKQIGFVKFDLNVFSGNIVWIYTLDPRNVYKAYLTNTIPGWNFLDQIVANIDSTSLGINASNSVV